MLNEGINAVAIIDATLVATKFAAMSVKEIEDYGLDVQSQIVTSVDNILKNTRCLELGKTQEHLCELTETSTVITDKYNKSKFLKPIFGVKRWLSRFDTVADKLDTVSDNILTEQKRLDDMVNALYQNREALNQQIINLTEIQQEFINYIKYLKENPQEDTDGLRMLAASSRLNMITSTVELSKTEYAKTLIIIKENKELAYQLREVQLNVIPIFKTMLVNSLALEANKRAIKLKETLSEVANKAVVESAKQIESDAEKLIEGRRTKILNPKNITEANQILLRTVEKISSAMEVEADENLKAIEEFQYTNAKMSALLSTALNTEEFTVVKELEVSDEANKT